MFKKILIANRGEGPQARGCANICAQRMVAHTTARVVAQRTQGDCAADTHV